MIKSQPKQITRMNLGQLQKLNFLLKILPGNKITDPDDFTGDL